MKKSARFILTSLAIVASLSACGKKNKASSPAAPAPAVNPTPNTFGGLCQLNTYGICVSGVGGQSYVNQGMWIGSLNATADAGRFIQFLRDYRMCSSCNRLTGRMEIVLGSRAQYLPGRVGFDLLPEISYGNVKRLSDRLNRSRNYSTGKRQLIKADAYTNADGNGFQLVYSSYMNQTLGYGMSLYGSNFRFSYGPNGVLLNAGSSPSVLPYGANTAATFAAEDRNIQIILSYVDASKTVANVAVFYQGAQIAVGQVTPRYY